MVYQRDHDIQMENSTKQFKIIYFNLFTSLHICYCLHICISTPWVASDPKGQNGASNPLELGLSCAICAGNRSSGL